MSLSTTGGIDANTIVNGGKEFVRHLADFQEAAAAHKKAPDDLDLGKSRVQPATKPPSTTPPRHTADSPKSNLRI